jgi:hypothetical protein
MSTTPYARLLVSLNGGAAAAGKGRGKYGEQEELVHEGFHGRRF